MQARCSPLYYFIEATVLSQSGSNSTKKEARSYSGYIVLGVLPILAVGFVFREQLDIFFSILGSHRFV